MADTGDQTRGRGNARRIVEDLCGLLRRLAGADGIAVWVYDATWDSIRPYASSMPEARPTARVTVDLREQSALRGVLFRGETLRVADVDSEGLPSTLRQMNGFGSFRCERLMTDKPVGLVFLHPDVGPLSVDASSVLDTLAVAVGEAWSRQGAEQQRATAELLVDLAASTAEEASASHLLHEACRLLALHLGVRRASIYLRDHATGAVVPRMSAFADGTSDPVRFSRFRSRERASGLDSAIDMAEPAVVTGRDIDPEWREVFQVRSALLIPFRKPPSVSGLLVLDDAEEVSYSGFQIRLASAVAMHVASVVERAETAAERELQLRTAEAVRRLLVHGAEAGSAEQAAATVARVAYDVLGAEHSIACLVDEKGQIVHIEPVNIPASYTEQLREMFVGTRAAAGLLGELTLEQGTTVLVDDSSGSWAWSSVPTGPGRAGGHTRTGTSPRTSRSRPRS